MIDRSNQRDSSDDSRRVFLSRIPAEMDEERLLIVLEREFGNGSKEAVDEKTGSDDDNKKGNVVSNVKLLFRENDEKEENEQQSHKGCAFVTFSTSSIRDKAVEAKILRAKCTDRKKRKYTIYIRPIVQGGGEDEDGGVDTVCYVWERTGKCPHGESCKFSHGDSTLEERYTERVGEGQPKKPPKCFNFRKKGKCKQGDSCPYSHATPPSLQAKKQETTSKQHNLTEKDCFSWKIKGKCSRGVNKCPYRHDEQVKLDALAKKKKKSMSSAKDEPKKKKRPSATKTHETDDKINTDTTKNPPTIGEYGQKVKRRKRHGFAKE